jgi:hypothetical protein
MLGGLICHRAKALGRAGPGAVGRFGIDDGRLAAGWPVTVDHRRPEESHR